ncbi:transporter substrate-binding domain-containing protein [Paraburkholderia sp. Tr-20389]|uniref:c-type cytochrome n=1 Tax=Paraburkholderia sp. Tr-20389 TaxID=2703903 RepID=UPI00197DEB8B|nr:c-type cytochrome [Paraburkholderia sp. Tr-20389]MBN3758839.1 transporter substrate-binding domain-containing protein [Paraburkholderia sp. Tr-20389]
MNHSLNRIPAASVLAACVALTSVHATAAVKVCTFPGSPSASLDEAVARDAFAQAGIAATIVKHGIGDGDDDGVSLKELDKTLARECDVIAGFPRSTIADGSNSKLQFSRGYLRAGYVSIEAPDANPQDAAKNTVAATYASPAQLIAVQQPSVKLHLENTSALTVEAVAKGQAQRAIVWYPAVVAYQRAHPQRHFTVAAAHSPYADWQLVFAFGPRTAGMRQRIDAALDKLSGDGRLVALTHDWAMPAHALDATANDDAARYRDGPAASRAVAQHALLATANADHAGRFVKVAADAGGAPSFDQAQATHGKQLYSAACAKCHGAQLQGVTAPALQGPAFAPASNAHLTIGGVFTYLSTNMPADKPGKMKDQDYADIMAFLLYSNGYHAGGAKMTADDARASTMKLNAGK